MQAASPQLGWHLLARICICSIVVALLSSTVDAQDAQDASDAATDEPSVLFIGWRLSPQIGGATRAMFLRELAEEHGFNVALREQEFGYQDRPGNVDPAEFDDFDVIVYLEPAWPRPDGRLTDTFREQWEAVLEFVERGGGLLYMPVQTEPYRYSTDKIFQPLGLRTLSGKPVDTSATRATVMRIAFSRTEELAHDHPVTRDVGGLWVPLYGHEGENVYNANSVSFRVDEEWDVIARHAPSVRTLAEQFSGLAADLPEPTAADREQRALLAARSVEHGRVAFLGLHSAYHIMGGRAPAHENIFLNDGLQAQPSDGERLIVNLLHWLGAPAQQNPELGGAPTEPDAIQPPTFEPLPPKEAPATFAPQRPGYKGIIGAISPRSGGQDTVAAYADRAKELGFDFLVVLDDLEKVTAEEYAKTDAEAVAASSGDFACIAGLRFRDEVGNRYVAFRQGLRFPDADELTDNQRFQTVRDRDQRGTRVGLLGWVQSFGHRAAVVHYRDQRDLESDDPYEYGTPAWDIRPYRTFHSVFTYDVDGQKIDEMIGPHKTVVADGQHPHPVSLTFLDNVADMDRVASGELPHTVRWTDDFDGFARDTSEAPAYLPTTYATEGPRITRWQWDSRDLVSNGKYWDWTYYYQRWAIGVESDAGLAKVEIWDGEELVRRWPLDGEHAFETVCVVNKHQLTMPLIIATDVNGKRAVTDGFQWRSHNFFVSWCSDRINTLSHSALPSPESPWGSSAGTWPLTTQPKGPFWDNVQIDLNLDVLRLPGFDGQAHGNVRINPEPRFHPAEGEPRDGRQYRHITWPMGSHEAVVQESRIRWQLLPEQQGAHGWATHGPIRETEVVEGRLRYTTFVHWAHEPAPVLVEGEYTFKQDVTADPDRFPISITQMSAGAEEADYRGAAVQRTGERNHAFALLHNHHDQHRARGRLPEGAYVWYWPSLFGPIGVISLDDDLHYRMDHSPNRYITRLSTGEPGRTYKKGETVRWRYLAVTSGFNDRSGIETPERLIDLLGIGGEPGYDVQAVDGEVASVNYLLTLQPGADNAGFRGRLVPGEEIRRTGLPAALPLVVDGLNDRWTAVLWDEQEQAMRPLPVAEGKSYAHYRELREPRSLFMGHPFVSDDPDVIITVVQTGPESLYLYVHNPTDESRDVSVSQARHFDAMSFEDAGPWHWTLAPGGERHLHLGPETDWTPAFADAP